MRQVQVVCGIIMRAGTVLAALRRNDDHGYPVGGWEFPGGKVEPGEDPEQALRRELVEELGVGISTAWYFDTVERDEPGWRLVLNGYVCPVKADCEPTCREHAELRWLARDELHAMDWLPADSVLAERLEAFWDQLFLAEHL